MDNKLRILAVDDNVISLATIEQRLKNDYEVITVNSGMRAIRYIKSEKPDLILLDIQMALMDGIETLTKIRSMENGAAIPVIMLTSKKDRETIIESSKLGVSDYVLKPFDPQDLQERIQRVLKRTGAIPVGDSELYGNVVELKRELRDDNIRNAIIKIDEILNFNIDDEIAGRIQNARARLVAGDKESSARMVARVIKILEKNLGMERAVKIKTSMDEINGKLENVLNDLEDFKVKEAAQKLDDALRYDIPADAEEFCEEAKECLGRFDDGAAEGLIRKALNKIGKYLM